MKRKLLILIALFAVIGCENKNPTIDYRKANDQAGVLIKLKSNKSEYIVGEEIVLKCKIANKSNNPIFIQSKKKFVNLRLTVTIPGGNEFLYDGYPLKNISPPEKDDYVELAPNKKMEMFTLNLKAGEICNSRHNWICIQSDEILPPPFKMAGKYSIKAEYMDMFPKKEGALKGPIRTKIDIYIK